jgi:hypothetical protein
MNNQIIITYDQTVFIKKYDLNDMIINNNAHITNNKHTIINNQDQIMIIYNDYIP